MSSHICILCPTYRAVGMPKIPTRPPACDGCRHRLRAELAEIPDLYALLPTELEPSAGGGPKVSGTRTPPLPLSIGPLNLLGPGADRLSPQAVIEDQVGTLPPLVVLDLWVRDWRDARDRGEGLPVPTMSRLSGWLLIRLDWAVDHHPAVDEFAGEIRQTLRAIRAVVQAERAGEAAGRCPSRLRDDTRCNTRLYADPYVDRISCTRCGTSWDRRDGGWMHLRAQQAEWETDPDEGRAA